MLFLYACAGLALYARGDDGGWVPFGKMVLGHFAVDLSLCLWIHLGMLCMYIVCMVSCWWPMYVCACDMCLHMLLSACLGVSGYNWVCSSCILVVG